MCSPNFFTSSDLAFCCASFPASTSAMLACAKSCQNFWSSLAGSSFFWAWDAACFSFDCLACDRTQGEAAASARELQLACRHFDCLKHASRVGVMHHVAGARGEQQLASGNSLRQANRVALMVDIAVLRAGDEDWRHGEIGILMLHREHRGQQYGGFFGARTQLRRPQRHPYRK